jgi:hypothetical protein
MGRLKKLMEIIERGQSSYRYLKMQNNLQVREEMQYGSFYCFEIMSIKCEEPENYQNNYDLMTL